MIFFKSRRVTFLIYTTKGVCRQLHSCSGRSGEPLRYSNSYFFSINHEKGSGLNGKFDLFLDKLVKISMTSNSHMCLLFFFLSCDLLSGLGRTFGTTNLVVAAPF